MNLKEQMISSYISAYNLFDVHGMVAHMDENVVFKNVINGQTNLSLAGIQAFKMQAEQALQLFTTRKQTVTHITHNGDEVTVGVDYTATLAIDLPNGLKQGDEVNLKGKSVFKFHNYLIVELMDIS